MELCLRMDAVALACVLLPMISVFVVSRVKISPFALMYGSSSDFVCECSGIVEALGDSVKGFEVIFSLISGKD